MSLALADLTEGAHSPAELLARRLNVAPAEIEEAIGQMTEQQIEELLYDWKGMWARPKQLAPPEFAAGNKYVWLLLSGRGFGKTRVGAEQVREWVGGPEDPPIRIALIAETAADARDVLVEGDSGILACSPPWNMPRYEPSNRRLVWPNGSIGITFSGEDPDQLRGPQFDKAWVDELAKYRTAQEVWDNLEFGLRLGRSPQAVVTTTPRPIPIIKAMLEDDMVAVTTGSSYENYGNLAPSFIRRVIKKYEGTRLGRQELHAEVLMDTPGALWTYEMIDQQRVPTIPVMSRVVVAIDPAVTNNEDSDETGILVCGKGVDGFGYVLRDASARLSPGEWAKRAVELYEEFSADRIVAEVNNGGDLVERVIRTVDPNVSYKSVRASKGKYTRAEPVAALYEQHRIWHHGVFPVLEDQMTTYTPDGTMMEGNSPDHMDALVWAFTELMFGSRIDYNPRKWRTIRR